MKTLNRIGFAAVAVLVLVTLRIQAEEAKEVTIVDVEGSKPAKVQLSDLVRVTGKGIAGATIKVKVEGAGKLQLTSRVRRIKDGQPIIGVNVQEFIIKPTMKGTIMITVTVKNPTEDRPREEKYQIDVQ